MTTRLKKKTKLLMAITGVTILLIIGIIALFNGDEIEQKTVKTVKAPEPIDTILQHSLYVDSILSMPRKRVPIAEKRRRAIGFHCQTAIDYGRGFPDLNDVQLATASRLGIAPITDRKEAMKRKDELVFIGENPRYVIDDLGHSIPYLVPRAARLLDEIACSFQDSLASRGLPFYKLFVTSVLRTKKDVQRLRRVNANASEHSCHCHGTTFDIAYTKFIPVRDPKETGREVWPAELKQVLADVLYDLRRRGTCYIRYEYHQSCFHITAR